MLTFSVVLGLAQIIAASDAASLQRGYRWSASPRDEKMPPQCGVWPGAWIGHYATSWRRFRCSPPSSSRPTSRPHTTPYREGCAALPLGSRRVYVPLYAAGVPLLRSLVWNVVTLGIVLLVVALLLG